MAFDFSEFSLYRLLRTWPERAEPSSNPYIWGPYSNPRAGSILDANGDGLNDIVIFPSYGSVGPHLPPTVLLNDGAGGWLRQEIELPGFLPENINNLFSLSWNGGQYLIAVDQGWETDNDPSQFRGSKIWLVKYDPATGSFVDQSDLVPGNAGNFNHVSWSGDLDSNGLVDILVPVMGTGSTGTAGRGLRWLEFGEDVTDRSAELPAQFAYRTVASDPPPTLLSPGGVGVGDLNGDGINDLVAVTYQSEGPGIPPAIRIYLGAARGFDPTPLVIPAPDVVVQAQQQFGSPMGGFQALVIDTNGDRANDLLVFWEHAGITYVQALVSVNGDFVDQTASVLGSLAFRDNSVRDSNGNFVFPIALAEIVDVNGDGRPDVYLRSFSAGPIDAVPEQAVFWVNDGAGHFQAARLTGPGDAPAIERIVEATAWETWHRGYTMYDDVTGDGVPDIVTLTDPILEATPGTGGNLYVPYYDLVTIPGIAPPPPEVAVSGLAVNIIDGDTTPSGSDGTDFGSVPQGTTVERVFTVSNSGTAALTTSGLILPAGFSLVEALSASIAASGSDSFTVRLDGNTVATNSGLISFATNDSDESPFNFAITGTVTGALMPEIAVSGLGVDIADGNTSLGSTDGTDFGAATKSATVDHVFTVSNTGASVLTTSSLTLPSGFSLVEGLSASIAAGDSDTFTVRLDTTIAGTSTGPISFATNDGDENPFNFSIAGTVYDVPDTVPIETLLGSQPGLVSIWNQTASPAYQFTYRFEDGQPLGSEPWPTLTGWTSLSAEARAAIQSALHEYEDVLNVVFTEAAAGDPDPDISFGIVTLPAGVGGQGFYSFTYGYDGNGQVTSRTYDGLAVFTDARVQDRNTELHEVGHVLSLKHPGNYNVSGGGSPPPYLPEAEDNNKFSVMSYNENPDSESFASQLMLYDIVALQARWGANAETRTGDDVYGAPGQYESPSGNVYAIWDAGGHDTIRGDAPAGVRIDLHAGSFSSLGATDNLAIAYGVTIEEAVGGSGNDVLIGNAVANVLTGGAGDDQLEGQEGNDLLRGGPGADQLAGGSGIDAADYSTATAAVVVNLGNPGQNGGEATGDTYLSIENVTGSRHDGDVLTGDDGDNAIDGLDGYNTLDGGAGNDTLIGGAGPNFIYAGYGDDTVTGGAGLNSVFGFLGNDALNGGDSGNTMNGEDGTDTLNGGGGVDYLIGGAGDDLLNGGGSGDALFGDDPSNPSVGGNDTLNGGDGDDGLDGGAGDDGLNGGKGVDWLYGQAGNDQLDGGDDTDALFGGDGNDIVHGGTGGDSVDGGIGDDQVFGDEGVDWLFGQAGNDALDGGSGGDVLFAGDGNDGLEGGAGGDSLDGGAGNDTLDGGAGIDVLFGNGGADTFAFLQPSDGGDVVRDFNAAEGDTVAIDLVGFGLSAALAGQFLPDAMFESGSGLPASFLANGPVFYLETQNHGLWFDPTGGSSGDLTIVAGFETGMPTNAHDLLIA